MTTNIPTLAIPLATAQTPAIYLLRMMQGASRFHQMHQGRTIEERARQDEVAQLLERVRQGEMTLREAANTVDDLLLL